MSENGWRRYDACQPVQVALAAGTTEAQSVAVSAGLAFWNHRAGTRLALVDPGESPDLVLRFQKASLASLGFYDPDAAVISINSGIADPHDMAVTVAHEVGHALGLQHVGTGERGSVMNPGNRTIEPTEDDIVALAAIWGPCPR